MGDHANNGGFLQRKSKPKQNQLWDHILDSKIKGGD
jgi:hypothetical protein